MWLIYKKEILEMLRDKRTLIFSILLPTLIFPVIFFFLGKFTMDKTKEAQEKEINIAFVNVQQMPGLEPLFTKEKGFNKKTLESDDFKSAILNKEVDYILEVSVESQLPVLTKSQQEITLYYKGSSRLNNIMTTRVNKIIDAFNNAQRRELGAVFNLSNDNVKAFNSPLEVKKENFATKRERTGEMVGPMTAYILILLAVAGAMYPALEIGVGEKERGTLETLLLTPMPKSNMVLAKFAVIFTTSFLSVAVTLLSYLFWTYIFTLGGKMINLSFLSNISSLDILLVAVLLIPLTSIFASLMLCASIYAKNMKEAQAYMSPIMMMGFLPVIIAFVPGMELNWKTAMIPVTNVALAMKDLIKGTVDYSLIGVLLASTLVIAGAMLYFATQFFKKEKVLFRS
ncbi:ABC transporter permease [Kangiella sp. TOML190]|uniref:ABC transporter permease n=1 Tax=Kangiella sp. TOML190 TaxID=2931351 RepID=UPI0020420CC6|nr:ABC transporter permease [Kangiella sp. TOML190]